ncbi:MAG TPA: tetratricopeptide repeat protein [Bryobacteraceae bacterium]|jgi:hypothetical protein
MPNTFTTVTVAAMLAIAPAVAQTATELLQRGIYAQQTTGDLDGAIHYFQQAIQTGSASRPAVAQALYHLGTAQAAKGDLTSSGQTLRQLVDQYSEQRDLAARLAQYLPAYKPAANAPNAPVTVYRDPASGVSFVLPPGYTADQTLDAGSRRPDPPTLIHVHAPGEPTFVTIFVRSEKTDMAALDQTINSQADIKEKQMHDDQKPFVVHRDTVRKVQIGSARGVSMLADVTPPNHAPRSEFFTYLWGARTRVMVFKIFDTPQAAQLQPVFDGIASTLLVP